MRTPHSSNAKVPAAATRSRTQLDNARDRRSSGAQQQGLAFLTALLLACYSNRHPDARCHRCSSHLKPWTAPEPRHQGVAPQQITLGECAFVHNLILLYRAMLADAYWH